MPQQLPISVVTRGEVWPSGRSKVIALLDVDDAWVEGTVGVPLIADFEDGLGDWVGAGGKLESGAPVELVKYKLNPSGPLFELRTDHDADAQQSLADFVAATRLDPAKIRWRHAEGRRNGEDETGTKLVNN